MTPSKIQEGNPDLNIKLTLQAKPHLEVWKLLGFVESSYKARANKGTYNGPKRSFESPKKLTAVN